MTDFANKCQILAELWLNYRDDEDFADFIEYNDLGLPLAYMISNNIVDPSENAVKIIDETFALLLEALELEDEDFEDLDEMLAISADGGQEEQEEAPPTPSKTRLKF